jgi:hypothetical protein
LSGIQVSRNKEEAMDWVRIYPLIANWPGGGSPPVFEITADENANVVIELAWDPQALRAPGSYTDPLRYYSTDVLFSPTVTYDDGSKRTLSIPAQAIQLNGNRTTWAMPADLWDAYVQETLKTVNSPPKSTFSRNIYYRVRATPPGGSKAQIWPPDELLTHRDRAALPRIGILPMSATLSSQVVPDQAAVQAMGGIAIAPRMWSDMLMALWRSLPEADAGRQALVAIFAHEAYQNADLRTRVALLKLWLFAGPNARLKLPRLLSRNTVVGSNLTQSIITKVALVGGKTLAENLLELLWITPHWELANIRTKEQLLDDVITEILDPNGQVNQGPAGTCVPTSIQTLLLTVNPSEYVRLQLGLLSSTSTATLANGVTIQVPPLIYLAITYKTNKQPFLLRTYSELAFQVSMLRYAQGSRFPAISGPISNIANVLQATITAGLTSGETKKALDALFNVNFTEKPGNAANFIADLQLHQQQMILWLVWGAPAGSPGSGLHAVMAIRYDQGTDRIFFKNPQYPGSNPPNWIIRGGSGTNPPRRWDDPSNALESMTQTDLSAWISRYFVPDTAII